MEKWRDIEGFEGIYQVSSFGRIKRLKHWKFQDTTRSNKYTNYRMLEEKILSSNNNSRYSRITLFKGKHKKTESVHRLVAKAFLPNPKNLPEINHKDCDTHNNKLSNLEWCDRKYNINYADRTEKAIRKIEKPVLCVETGKIYKSGTEAAIQNKLQKSKICLVCKGKRKTTGGFHWQFASKMI